MQSLETKIKNQILLNGPISISEYMQICLFDNIQGYYTNEEPFGSKGDFITSPEISQAFGEILALYFINAFCDYKDEIQIIELGPGRGELMSDIIRTLQKFPKFLNKISINLVEKSSKLRKIQESKLSKFNLPIKFYDEFSQIEEKLSFILANEFFDCLPMQQYEFSKNKWYERKINLIENKLNFQLVKSLEMSSISNLLLKNTKNKDGDIFEFSPSSISTMRIISDFIKNTSSKSLIVDYGYLKYDFKPTLQAVKNHSYQNIFHHIGKQDLTYLVDFNALSTTAKQCNINNLRIFSQGYFLNSLGIAKRIEMLKKNKSNQVKSKLDQALFRLTDKTQMGELFKILEIY